MKYILVDVETYGPCPGIHPLVSIGAINYNTREEFYVELYPDKIEVVNEAFKIAESALRGGEVLAEKGMKMFYQWLMNQQDKIDDPLIFVSDSTWFDAAFINYYMWTYCNDNPFGHSSLSLVQLFKGMKKDTRVNIWKLRPEGSHTHNALDDCRGNVVVLDKLIEQGLKFKKEGK